MDAAQIAAKLTPAQVRAMRASRKTGKPTVSTQLGWLDYGPLMAGRLVKMGALTPLGLAVLAALDAKEAGNE